MNTERIRQLFEEDNSLPEGVHWDGAFYAGTHGIAGSFSNATIWNHMYCGFLKGYTKFANTIAKEVLS